MNTTGWGPCLFPRLFNYIGHFIKCGSKLAIIFRWEAAVRFAYIIGNNT